MATLTEHQPTTKKAKHAPDGAFACLENPPHAVAAIAHVFLASERSQVFLWRGDRHFWDDKLKSDWSQQFWPKDHTFAGAPFQVYTVGPSLTFCGKEYGPVDMTRYILADMLQKSWVPTCCFPTAAAARAALADDFDVATVDGIRLVALHAMLTEFTQRVSGQHYHEVVMGAVDGGATQDMRLVEATLYKETEEEAGVKLEDKTQFHGWSKPFTSRRSGTTTVTAIFVTDVADKAEMQRAWAEVDAIRRPEGVHNWCCPHSWFKRIPGIDLVAAAREKALQETQHGAWYTVDEALNRAQFVDVKNQDALKKLLGK